MRIKIKVSPKQIEEAKKRVETKMNVEQFADSLLLLADTHGTKKEKEVILKMVKRLKKNYGNTI